MSTVTLVYEGEYEDRYVVAVHLSKAGAIVDRDARNAEQVASRTPREVEYWARHPNSNVRNGDCQIETFEVLDP